MKKHHFAQICTFLPKNAVYLTSIPQVPRSIRGGRSDWGANPGFFLGSGFDMGAGARKSPRPFFQ